MINVQGKATLHGALYLALINGYTPAVGDHVAAFTFATRDIAFTDTTADWTYTINPTDITFTKK